MDHVDDLLSACQMDPVLMKEDVKNAFAQLQEVFRSCPTRDSFIQLVETHFSNILSTLSMVWFQRGEDAASGLFPMLCDWIQSTMLSWCTIPSVTQVSGLFLSLLRDHPHPTIIKSVLPALTTLFPIWMKYIYQDIPSGQLPHNDCLESICSWIYKLLIKNIPFLSV